MRIVPALYIKDGKLAHYKPGHADNLEFLETDPYELIAKMGELAVNRIQLIDVDGSIGEKNNHGLIGSLSNTCVVDLEVGGGITKMEYLKSLQYAGVDYFVIGSAVHSNFAFLKEIAQSDDVKNDRIMIALDVLDGKLTHLGWTEEVATDHKAIIEKCMNAGFSKFIVNDVSSREDTPGPDIDFYKELTTAFPEAAFSASGNVQTFEDVDDLADIGVVEVVVGNEIYKEEKLLTAISAYNKEHAPE
ncbi:MAG: HisA/HisF-related TIM barrel protein [Bacteroidota bacterium]